MSRTYERKSKIFGASLDPLNGSERVDIKRAYTLAVSAGRDIEPTISIPTTGICSVNCDLFDASYHKAGKVPVEIWLAPKSEPEDLRSNKDALRICLRAVGLLPGARTQ